MKKVLTYISLFVFGVALLSSCKNLNESPKFNDKDAFVAFDKAAVSVKEEGKEVKIPVTLASLKGIATTISYEAVDGTAKNGVDYTLADETGTLTFSAEARTQYITVNIIERDGLFTGDLKFSLKFKTTGDVLEGAENSCTITIQDHDHPLGEILGKYTGSANSSNKKGPYQWEMEIMKDASDVTMVWFAGIIPYFAEDFSYPQYDTRFYGIADLEAGTITVPLGQTCAYKYSGTYDIYLYGVDDNNYLIKSGNLVMEIDTTNGTVITCDGDIYVVDDTGAWDWLVHDKDNSITYTKK